MGSRVNGESRPNGLMDYLHFHSLLPTPNAAEGTNWTRTYNPDSQMGRGLTALAVNGLLLSPMSKDGFRAGLTMQALKNHNRQKRIWPNRLPTRLVAELPNCRRCL